MVTFYSFFTSFNRPGCPAKVSIRVNSDLSSMLCCFLMHVHSSLTGAGTRIQMHSVCMQVHACTSSRMSSFEVRLRPCSRCVCIHFYRLGNGCRHRKKCCSMEDGSQCLSEYTLIEVWSNPIKRTGVLCLFIWFRKGFILLHIVQGRWCMWSCMLRAFPADSLFIIAPHCTAMRNRPLWYSAMYVHFHSALGCH